MPGNNVWKACGAILILIALMATAVIHDIRTPLWTDELLTLYVSQQPTSEDVLASISDGVDAQPPAYAFLVRWLHPLIAQEQLRVRLLSTIGFFVMCVAVFWFAFRRLPMGYAVLAALFAARTTWTYATEGRSYGLVLGAVSLALVFWQGAAKTRRLPAYVGLSISLAAGVAFHYATVCVLLAFCSGEVVRWWKSRKNDWAMLAALMFPVLILVLQLPLIRAGKSFVKYFWSRPTASTLYGIYVNFLGPLLLPLFLAIVCSLWLAALRFTRKDETERSGDAIPVDEWSVVLMLTLLPELVVLVSLLTVETFVDRYVLWSMIGAGILLAGVLHRVARGSGSVAAIVMLPLLLWSTNITVAAASYRPVLRHGENLRNALAHVPAQPGPIVVSGVHAFMELWFYSEPALRDRLVYLVNPELEVRYLKTDTTSRLLSALGRWTVSGGTDYDQFIAANPLFILADDTGEWIVPHLRRMHYRLQSVGDEPNLYLAMRPRND